MENEKTKYEVKSYEELDFSDDFMFGKVTQDGELSRDLLECLLQREVGELLEVTAQKEFRYTKDGKPIRMDMYNRDSEMVYDSEMLKLNNKSVEFYQLPRRTRFYQASIDTDHMQKKASYKSLPKSTIIMICTFDPFKRGLAKYTITPRCMEDEGLKFDDGTERIFFNCTYKGDDIPEELKLFYEYMQTGSVKNDLTNKIDAAVMQAKKREEWKSEYMKERVLFMDAREEGWEKGREEGELRRFIELICKKISKGKDVHTIAEELEEDNDSFVSKICVIAEKYAPEYNVDKIFNEYINSKTAAI